MKINKRWHVVPNHDWHLVLQRLLRYWAMPLSLARALLCSLYRVKRKVARGWADDLSVISVSAQVRLLTDCEGGRGAPHLGGKRELQSTFRNSIFKGLPLQLPLQLQSLFWLLIKKEPLFYRIRMERRKICLTRAILIYTFEKYDVLKFEETKESIELKK